MAPSKTRTIKNKHAGSKSSDGGAGKSGPKRSATDGISKSRKPKGPVQSQQLKEKNRAALSKKPKKKIYSEKELGIPTLNKITPVGVVKPPGKKKGKVFVDDKVRKSPSTRAHLLSLQLTIALPGEYEHYPFHGPGRDGWPDRVEDDQGPSNGGDSRG
jgi:hypothetical protein